MVKLSFRLIMVFVALFGFSSQAANISISVDRDPVQINESFKIMLEADDNISAEPDLSPLRKHFKILGQRQYTTMKYINGQSQHRTSWNYTVMAKRPGQLTIPSIRVGADESPSISVTVEKEVINTQKDAVSHELFIETEANPSTLFVQAQVIYSIRIFSAVNISSASLSEPRFSGGDVVVEKLGGDTNFETHRNGQRYVVTERKYALYPQQSGKLRIEPMQLEAQIVMNRPGVFDPFGRNTETKRLKSEAIELDVRPIPAEASASAWLPATDLRLYEKWSSDEFVVGEPVTRTLTLKAEGLTAAQLPSLAMADGQDFKTYPDQPRMNDKWSSRGISGTRQEKIAIIPTQPGTLNLPAVEIPWWNVNTHQLETAQIPARTVMVKAGAQTTSPPPIAAVPSTSIAATETPMPPLLEGPATGETAVVTAVENGLWFKLAIFFGLGWLLTAGAWVYSARERSGKVLANTTVVRTRNNLNGIKKACNANDAHATQAALLDWAKGHWPEQPPANLAEIGQRLGLDVAQELTRLNHALYGANTQAWQADSLLEKLKRALKENRQQKTNSDSNVIAPLYP